jgi:4-amino-4-deoxy-L-arabinose transferase-like glycosyltransferase
MSDQQRRSGKLPGQEARLGTRLGVRPTLVDLAAVLVLAIAVRLVLLGSAPTFVISHDSPEYFDAGYRLAQGGEFSLPLKRPPLYPVFLAAAAALVGPSLQSIALLQHALGLVAVVLVYWLGRLAFGRGTGLLAAGLTALNGAMLLMEHTLISEVLFAPLLLGFLLALVLGLRGRGRWHFLLAGLLLGLAALTRPATQAVVPLVIVAVVLAPLSWRPRLLAVGLILAGFAATILPWMLRQQATYGTFAITSGAGDALYTRIRKYDEGFVFRDLSPRDRNDRAAQVRRRTLQLARVEESGREVRGALRAEYGLTEAQSDAALRDAVTQVIRQQPAHYLVGTSRMFLRLFLAYDDMFDALWHSRWRVTYEREWPEAARTQLLSRDVPAGSDRQLTEMLLGLYQDRNLSLPVLALFLIGGGRCLSGRERRWLLLVPAIVVSQLLLYVALDGPLPRYRFPFQPMITLLAAAGLTFLLGWLWAALERVDRSLLTRGGRRLPLVLPLPRAASLASEGVPGRQRAAPEQPEAALHQPGGDDRRDPGEQHERQI